MTMNLTRATLQKLPYTLLELINNESTESVDYIISEYLLKHICDLQEANIQNIADACTVSKSTISRFCRRAGLDTFQSVKEQLELFQPFRDRFFFSAYDNTDSSYLQQVASQILQLDASLDYRKINRLVEQIHNHENVVIMGYMQASNPATNLQQDLFASNKVTRSPGGIILCAEAIEKAKPGDLIIVFSNSGNFFERIGLKKSALQKLSKLDIWMITGNQNINQFPYVNDYILVPDNNSYVSHPTQFYLVESVIALAYAEYSKKLEH